MINKKRLKEILKSQDLTGLEIYNFKVYKKTNKDPLLKFAYLNLRKVFKYNAKDFEDLKNKCLKFENWQLKSWNKNNCNEFRTLILDIVN
jgi:hypothetical protein